jgi:DNA-binding beta-propeller fold protein YncE
MIHTIDRRNTLQVFGIYVSAIFGLSATMALCNAEGDSGTVPVAHDADEIPFHFDGYAQQPNLAVVYGINYDEKRLTRIDLATGMAVREWVFDDTPTEIAFQPDGDRLYVALADVEEESYEIVVIDAVSVAVKSTLAVKYYVTSLVATDEGKIVLSGWSAGLGGIVVYDRDSGLILSEIVDTPLGGANLILHPSGVDIYGVHDVGDIVHWKMDTTNGELSEFKKIAAGRVLELYFVKEGEWIVTDTGQVRLALVEDEADDLRIISAFRLGCVRKG